MRAIVDTPFAQIGSETVVRRIVTAFYDHMDCAEPALARLHRLDADGRVHPEARERFALFLIGWLGGPQTYVERYGHPRLRMRHAHVQIDRAARDAWMRCMIFALDEVGVSGDVRAFVETKLAAVAEMLAG
jgi:hemoglobin